MDSMLQITPSEWNHKENIVPCNDQPVLVISSEIPQQGYPTSLTGVVLGFFSYSTRDKYLGWHQDLDTSSPVDPVLSDPQWEQGTSKALWYQVKRQYLTYTNMRGYSTFLSSSKPHLVIQYNPVRNRDTVTLKILSSSPLGVIPSTSLHKISIQARTRLNVCHLSLRGVTRCDLGVDPHRGQAAAAGLNMESFFIIWF